MYNNPINPNNSHGWKQGYYIPKNPQKYIGHVDKRGIPYRSSLEYKFMIMIDNNRDVLRWTYEHNDTIIPYYDNIHQKHRTYHPDFYMECMINGKICTFLVEVKPYSQTIYPNRKCFSTDKAYKNQLYINAMVEIKRRAAEEFCKKKGWKYMFVTEKFFQS